MAATCAHGFESGTCLICATLGTTAASDGRSRTTTATDGTSRVEHVRSLPAGTPEVMPHHRRRLGLLGWLVLVVAFVLLAWWVIGLVWAALRVVELALVGIVCGYVGYRLGAASRPRR